MANESKIKYFLMFIVTQVEVEILFLLPSIDGVRWNFFCVFVFEILQNDSVSSNPNQS